MLELIENSSNESSKIEVLSVMHSKLSAVAGELKEPINVGSDSSTTMEKKGPKDNSSKSAESKEVTTSTSKHKQAVKRHTSDSSGSRKHRRGDSRKPEPETVEEKDLDDIEALLSTKSAKEQDSKRVAEEIQELLGTASTKELSLAEKFRTMGGSQVPLPS